MVIIVRLLLKRIVLHQTPVIRRYHVNNERFVFSSTLIIGSASSRHPTKKIVSSAFFPQLKSYKKKKRNKTEEKKTSVLRQLELINRVRACVRVCVSLNSCQIYFWA